MQSLAKKCAKIIFGLMIFVFAQQMTIGQTNNKQEIFLPEDWQKSLKAIIPRGVDYPSDIRFYNHTPAFQMDGGLIWTGHNPAANPDPYGNANRDFPWAITSGLHLSPKNSYTVYKATSIPGITNNASETTSGLPTEIIYYRGRNRFRNNLYFANEPPSLVWIYPEDTVFMEFLTRVDSKDQKVFEVRKRTKKANGDWVPEIYRPFASIDELPPINGLTAHQLLSSNQPNTPYKKVSKRIVDGPGQIDATVEMIEIPDIDIPPETIFKKSSLILTTKSDNAFIPKDFLGNITNCTACHTQTQKHSRMITPGREWYGNVRGSDQIFSFSIFDESSIDYGGFIRQPLFRPLLRLRELR